MRSGPQYIPTLDGWRALAVIGVILFHGRVEVFRSSSFWYHLFAHGSLGVDIFFAISGFLICGLLLHEYATEGGFSLGRFYIRRCFRILPPYYAVLAVLCGLSVLGIISVNLADLPSCLLFFRNYRPLGIDGYGGFYTAHFWTLAVEEHFYLVWPMLLLLLKPRRAGWVACLLAVLVFAWRVVEGHFQLLAHFLPQANLLARTDTRIDSLLWGCVAALYFPTIKRFADYAKFSQLWMPVLGILLMAEIMRVPGLTMVQAVLFPAMVLSTVIQPDSLLGRVLEWKILRWIGSLSYSIYLWQELFLPETGAERAHDSFGLLQHWPGNVFAILVCACVSRYWIEVPMSRLGHRLSTSRPSPALVLATPAAAKPKVTQVLTLPRPAAVTTEAGWHPVNAGRNLRIKTQAKHHDVFAALRKLL